LKEWEPKTVIPVALLPTFLKTIFAFLVHRHSHFLRKWKCLRLQRLGGWCWLVLCQLQ